MNTATLFDTYDYYRSHTENYKRATYRKSLKRSRDRLQKLDEMAHWCASRGIDPQYWLYSLFASRRWFYAPRWDQLCSERNIPNYEKCKPTEIYADRVRVQFTLDRQERQFIWWRDIGGTAEALKRKYAQRKDPQRCYYEFDKTYGYHPRSPICTECPLAQTCIAHLKTQVRFDILALRRGDLTLEQARVIEANA